MVDACFLLILRLCATLLGLISRPGMACSLGKIFRRSARFGSLHFCCERVRQSFCLEVTGHPKGFELTTSAMLAL